MVKPFFLNTTDARGLSSYLSVIFFGSCRRSHHHDVAQVGLRLGELGLVAGLADGWQEDADQQRDDRHHHQQLDDRERSGVFPCVHG